MRITHDSIRIFGEPLAMATPGLAGTRSSITVARKVVARVAVIAITLGLSAFAGMRAGTAGAPRSHRVASGSVNATDRLAAERHAAR
ncbi:MAG TPA: hypothetical protein VJT67_18000 [Longimicrobiaceae bacterium]|nr:hypothetical protein [Longimicrobiaceae bacterium]